MNVARALLADTMGSVLPSCRPCAHTVEGLTPIVMVPCKRPRCSATRTVSCQLSMSARLWPVLARRRNHSCTPFRVSACAHECMPMSQCEAFAQTAPAHASAHVPCSNNWKRMFVERPCVRCDGVYASRNTYFRLGTVHWDVKNPVHLVVYYRYFRFFPDGSVLTRTSPDTVSKVWQSLCRMPDKITSHDNLLRGRWKLQARFVWQHPRCAACACLLLMYRCVWAAAHSCFSAGRQRVRRLLIRGAAVVRDAQQAAFAHAHAGSEQPHGCA